nr:hypothetical protein [Pandoravirus aubagnensis]
MCFFWWDCATHKKNRQTTNDKKGEERQSASGRMGQEGRRQKTKSNVCNGSGFDFFPFFPIGRFWFQCKNFFFFFASSRVCCAKTLQRAYLWHLVVAVVMATITTLPNT